MIHWTGILTGGAAMATLCVGWLAWQRLAGRLDTRMRDRAPAGKCSLPGDMDAYERDQCSGCHGSGSRAKPSGRNGTADTAVAHEPPDESTP